MYGSSRPHIELPVQKQCNKCDSQRIHRAKALDTIERQGPPKDFEFATSKCRSSRESERQRLTPSKQKSLKQKTIILQIKSRTYPIRHNILQLCAIERIQRLILINPQPGQPKKQPSIRKKVLHEKDLIGNSYRDKNDADPAKTL